MVVLISNRQRLGKCGGGTFFLSFIFLLSVYVTGSFEVCVCISHRTVPLSYSAPYFFFSLEEKQRRGLTEFTELADRTVVIFYCCCCQKLSQLPTPSQGTR